MPTTRLSHLTLSQMKLYYHMCRQWENRWAQMSTPYTTLRGNLESRALADLASCDGPTERTP